MLRYTYIYYTYIFGMGLHFLWLFHIYYSMYTVLGKYIYPTRACVEEPEAIKRHGIDRQQDKDRASRAGRKIPSLPARAGGEV